MCYRDGRQYPLVDWRAGWRLRVARQGCREIARRHAGCDSSGRAAQTRTHGKGLRTDLHGGQGALHASSLCEGHFRAPAVRAPACPAVNSVPPTSPPAFFRGRSGANGGDRSPAPPPPPPAPPPAPPPGSRAPKRADDRRASVPAAVRKMEHRCGCIARFNGGRRSGLRMQYNRPPPQRPTRLVPSRAFVGRQRRAPASVEHGSRFAQPRSSGSAMRPSVEPPAAADIDQRLRRHSRQTGSMARAAIGRVRPDIQLTSSAALSE